MRSSRLRAASLAAYSLFLLGACTSEPADAPPEPGSPPAAEDSPAPSAPVEDAAPLLPPTDAVDRALWDFETFLATDPEPALIVNQIAGLSLRRDPRVARALIPLLRHPDETVRIAVMERIGEQKDPTVAALLKAVFDAAEKEKKWKIQAAALEGIADADPRANHDFLMKAAKKYVDVNGEVATAALRGAALWVTQDTVNDLLTLLLRVESTGPEDSREKAAARNASKPVIVDLLRGITGRDTVDPKFWKEWWDRNKETWKPAPEGPEELEDLNASDEFVDAAHGFILRRPSKRWVFRRPEGGKPYIVLEALDEGRRAAWVEVHVTGTQGLRSRTPESVADEQATEIEGKFRELKMAEWNRAGKLGGEHAVVQTLSGPHRDFDVVWMRNVYALRGETLYAVITCWRSGAPVSLRDDIGAILESFRWTK